MANTEIFVANNLLDASLGWQEVVDYAPTPAAKQETAQEACLALGRIAGYYGTRNVLVKSEAALMLRDTPDDEALWAAIQFQEIIAKGWLGKINYLVLNGHGTLTWPLYDAQVINTEEVEIATDDELPPTDVHYLPTDKIRRPLYIPVGMIDYALCAA